MTLKRYSRYSKVTASSGDQQIINSDEVDMLSINVHCSKVTIAASSDEGL